MEKEKKCFKCGEVKPLSAFYKHKQMSDGYLGKCKQCTRKDTKERTDELINNPEWVIKERKRNRDKYYRLGYKEKHKSTTEQKKIAMDRYKNKYPEKIKASGKAKHIKGKHGHHWSYNEQDYKSVLYLSEKDHNLLHRFLIYDQERFMYRAIIKSNNSIENELLDTKEKHEDYFNYVVVNFE